MEQIENHTYAELRVGDVATLTRTFGRRDRALIDQLTDGDASLDADADAHACAAPRANVEAGLWGSLLLSTLIGARLPGAGTGWVDQSLRFAAAIAPGDTLNASVRVTDKDDAAQCVTLACTAFNQRGECVIDGTVRVVAPTRKVARLRGTVAQTGLQDTGQRYQRLIAMTRGLEPLRTAVVHPVDSVSLGGAIEAAREGLIVPVLVGPEAGIRAAAEQAAIDVSPYAIVATAHSEAAAAEAVAMARDGRVEALMKGALHTDELMHAVVNAASGLRTARRISHVFAIDAPGYPRPLLVTDAAINVAPTLEDKRDIIQNAIDLAHALGIVQPRVAILSAIETVTEKLRSTLDAAALCKMAERGQITGGLLDGPLAFDNAVSEEAARTKGIHSPVAGRADVFVVPDLEAGNMLAKQLEYLAGAHIAGIVLGARVPIILTSRADHALARLASCAIALLLARHRDGAR